MKKKVYMVVLLGLIAFILYEISIPRIITPKDYFIASKERRLKIIKDIREGNCLSGDTISLIATYKEVFNDINTSQCWGNYRKECLKRNEENRSLKIDINCTIY